jgi:hypothetical protein
MINSHVHVYNFNFVIDLLSHFTAESYFKISNFRVYSTTHPDGTAHGGTAIIIKQAIDHYELQKYVENHLQATSIKVTTFPYDLTTCGVLPP